MASEPTTKCAAYQSASRRPKRGREALSLFCNRPVQFLEGLPTPDPEDRLAPGMSVTPTVYTK